MKNSYLEFEKHRQIYFEYLQSNFIAYLDNARIPIDGLHHFRSTVLDPPYQHFQKNYSAHLRFLIEVNNVLALDKNKQIEDVFNSNLEQSQIEDKETFISQFANYCAIDEMYNVVRNKLAQINPYVDRAESKKSDLVWKGENETEFVQIFYALFKAGYISNTEKKITHFIPEMAKLLNFQLSENWQNNLSKSIHATNNDYNPQIFDRLKTSFAEYQQSLINKKKKNSSQ
jgi:hypothetical protein